ESSPILRGAFVVKRIVCAQIAPPAGLDVSMFVPDPALPTTRERIENLTSPAGCAACHQKINPVGFAFEGFDQLGRPRSQDNGHPVNTRGAFVGLPVQGEFDGAEQMTALLLDSSPARECFARQWLTYLLARPALDDPAEQSALHAAADELSRSGVRAAVRA